MMNHNSGMLLAAAFVAFCMNVNTDATILANCKAYLDAGQSIGDGPYTIDPDGSGSIQPFAVTCDMTGGGLTIINHDQEKLTCVPSGLSGPGNHTAVVTYKYLDGSTSSSSSAKLVALIDSSAECSQDIRLICKGVQIWKDINSVSTQHTCWNNRNNNMRNNFGAKAGTDGCRCSITNSCLGGGDCNCDSQQDTEDRGKLRKKSDLPVYSMQFGDTDGPNKSSVYSLGPLICK